MSDEPRLISNDELERLKDLFKEIFGAPIRTDDDLLNLSRLVNSEGEDNEEVDLDFSDHSGTGF